MGNGKLLKKVHCFRGIGSFAMLVLCTALFLLWPRLAVAQTPDYGKKVNEILMDYLPDYPEPTLRALDALFSGVDVDGLPAPTKFMYYYCYGSCLKENNPEDALLYLTQAKTIASSNPDIGIRNFRALSAEKQLADVYLLTGTAENTSAALVMYNEIITVGASLLNDPNIAGLVIQSLVEEAKMGVDIWKDPEWVRKLWIQARDMALEVNDGTSYSYCIISAISYYCDLEDYDAALSFAEDAANRGIFMDDASSLCGYIQNLKELSARSAEIETSYGASSMEYWKNRLDIATLSTVLCSVEKSLALQREVEKGLSDSGLTDSDEYAQTLYLLSGIAESRPDVAEEYLERQIKVLEDSPEHFIYTTDVNAYNSLALCQMKLGKYSEAQGNYMKALGCLERDRQYADQSGYKTELFTLFHNIGRNLYSLGEYAESVEYLAESVNLQEEVNGTVLPKTLVYLSESQERLNLK